MRRRYASLVRRLVAPATGPAANDNGGGKSTDPAIVEAALRHFAEHGLGAARAARQPTARPGDTAPLLLVFKLLGVKFERAGDYNVTVEVDPATGETTSVLARAELLCSTWARAWSTLASAAFDSCIARANRSGSHVEEEVGIDKHGS